MAYYRFEMIRADGAAGPEGLLPVVQIEISARDATAWRTQAIVDSGADRTMIAAESLGRFGVVYTDLDLPRTAEAVTGDKFEVRRLFAQASLYEHVFATALDVAEPGKFASPLPMVGLNDFFAAFDVCFIWGGASQVRITPRTSSRQAHQD